MQLKRVVIGIPVLLIGGTEVHVRSLVRVLSDAGYEVILCCYYEYDDNMADEMRGAGARVILMKLERSEGLNLLFRKLVRLYRDLRPDVVHVQYLAPGLIPIIAAKRAGVSKVLATVHIAGGIAYGARAKFLLRIAASFCTAFICVSRGVEEFWFGSSTLWNPAVAKGDAGHTTIYNGIDTEAIETAINSCSKDAVRSSLDITTGPIIGIVGRLAFQKGQDVMLDAFRSVLDFYDNAVLLIVGDGPDRQMLAEKAERIGVSSHIRWTGALSPDKVYCHYSVMDVLAVPSVYEGFGLVAVEGMVAGLPVVASDVEGLREIVVDGVTGFLCPPQEHGTLSRRILDLIMKPELARGMGSKGRSRVIELFSAERFKNSILSLYETLNRGI